MALFKQSHFSASDVRSLCWRGDELVDWVGGGRAFTLDGAEKRAIVKFGYRFDAATASPDGRFVVIYERLGTKGLLLRDGRIVRELDRSYYFADAYEFPVVLFNAPDGRLLLAHCPGNYCRLELEEAETGRPLTASVERKPSDFFHSRLSASPDGRRLLSAGWLWHPLSLAVCYDVAQAIADPCHLDGRHELSASFNPGLVEESSACWLDDDRLAVAASAEPEQDSIEDDREPRLHPCGLAVYDVANRTCLRGFKMNEPPGTILPLGKRHVLSLYRHPKLIELSTGTVVHAWTELSSGRQDGSIIWGLSGDAMPPVMALDPSSGRFAIANGDTITVLEFNLPALNAM
ncbi:hypothetical protein JQ617_07660 [Bradyrhizobium sp. KB893862 SZCCT0404]|uniref:hypothetical protein n=1 Tax=Bradyrhizobium sp. KB893862 SZCCT0404 TaxID=2807672 RepID=UPI001BA6EF07|nr:hypothetical protein [Bradyrhizobium sp. KB893862 SZCCT0404]MBR1173826.1 hypothetical protein [Bradyrhizobium sp. KB893862 SZCCT0404]